MPRPLPFNNTDLDDINLNARTVDVIGDLDLLSSELNNANLVAAVNDTYNFTKLNGRNFKNKVINGDFSVWQRGTVKTGAGNAEYLADRWAVFTPTGNIQYDWIRVAGDPDLLANGFYYGLKIQKTGGTDYIELDQFIENVTQFQPGETVTISFWAKSTTATTPYDVVVAIQGSIGRFTETTPENVSSPIQVDNILRRYTVTLQVPDWSTLTTLNWGQLENTALVIKIRILNPGVSDDLVISGVQLEKGTVATNFEYVPFDVQLIRCMRYYEVQRSQNTNGTSITRVHNWRVIKRATPTVEIIEDISNTIYSPVEVNIRNLLFSPDGTNPYGIFISADADF